MKFSVYKLLLILLKIPKNLLITVILSIWNIMYIFKEGNRGADWISNIDYFFNDLFEWIIFFLLKYDNIF